VQIQTFSPFLGIPKYEIKAIFTPVSVPGVAAYNDNTPITFSTNDASASEITSDSYEGSTALSMNFGPAADWWTVVDITTAQALDISGKTSIR